MAEALLLGAAVGAVAGEVLHALLEAKDKVVNFREDFERLEKTLKRLLPMFEEGRKLDLELNDRELKGLGDLIMKLQKGKKLIQKCSKVSKINFIQKIRYSSKISSLDEAISSFCQRELQVDNWRDVKLLRLDFQRLSVKVDVVTSHLGGTKVVGSVGNEGLFAVPELPDRVVGFDLPLRELKYELFKENVTVLGVCAPGGRGKSTLVAMLCQDEQVRDTFKKILFLTVSRTPTLKILQRLLEGISGRVHESNLSEEDATKRFRYLLEERNSEPLLLVLDDVWDDSIIEKLFCRTEGYKMLVTSREAFKRYNYNYHSSYLLKTLSHQESMTLFRNTALSHGENVDYEPDEDLLDKIVRSCDGFPLAITVISKSLSLEPEVKWNIMARKLSNGSSNILDFDEKLRKCLAASLDSLKKTVRECFLDLGSFPEDERISASALIDIWCELYKLDYEDDAYVNLFELASRNLVNLVGSRKFANEIDGSYNKLFVTQHDLLRDMAIYESRQQSTRFIMDKREQGLPGSCRKQENHYLNARLVSLHTGEMCSKSWYDLQLPEAEVLILNFSASNYALPPFMEIRKLKVLIVVNHGRTHAKLSNSQTVGELANLKRIRLEKVSIPSLHEFTMPLMNLHKISLVTCEFGQALMQCTINVSYVLPNLVEVNIDYCDDLVELPPWICDIISLQKLSVTNCHNFAALPERIGCLIELDLLRLHACTELSKLPDSLQRLQKLRFLDISDCSNLEMLPDRICKLRCLKKLDMRGCIELKELPPSAMNLVHLKEVICDEDTASLWEPLSSNIKITVLKKDINLDWLGIDI
ncbi:hypothetical protein NE237_023200 [Protea cynaroides]|uniref:RPW8 domain-containing protein n=1 Tax=Protea cynaroides TaxID=273540 RepID=A0A9Q0HB12_9MAGN|nr:hypothetical protein NE237_023200 [Protea cynaroides]